MGVRILLTSGVRIPNWIRNQTKNISFKNEKIMGKTVRVLTIRGGGAMFIPGGEVSVQMPGSTLWWRAFYPMKVLMIQDLGKNVLIANNYLCEKCMSNSCAVQEIISESPVCNVKM